MRGNVVSAAVVLVLAAGACSGRSAAPATTAGATPAALTCLDPRQPGTRPAGGWLPDDGGQVVDGFPVELRQRDDSAGLRELAGALEGRLPDGFSVDRKVEFATDDCAVDRAVTAHRQDGAWVLVDLQQLRRARSLFDVPLGAGARHRRLEGGGESVTDDFNGEGTRLTAIVVTGDGLLARVTAAGPGAADLSGWPTTMVPPTSSVPAGPAPLTSAEVAALARSFADRAS